jgi:hypothetical protein
VGLLAVLQVVFLVVTFLISVFVSHRIAGPLFKLSQWMQVGRAGALRPDLYFRKADYFKEIATEYNLMVSGVLSRVDRNLSQLEELANRADGKVRTDLSMVIADLKNIREAPMQDLADDDAAGEGPQASSSNA